MRAGQKADEGEVNAAQEKETETDLRKGEVERVAVASDEEAEEEGAADEVDDKSDEEEQDDEASESEVSEAESADQPATRSPTREEKVRLFAVLV